MIKQKPKTALFSLSNVVGEQVVVIVIVSILVLMAILGFLFMRYKSLSSLTKSGTPNFVEEYQEPFNFVVSESSSLIPPALSSEEEATYAEVIRLAWRNAVKASPQHIVTFPNDPYLLGFRVLKSGDTDYTHYVVDIRKPIIVNIAPAEKPTPNNKAFTVEVEVPEKSYQLTVKLRHSQDLRSLDLEQLLKESFQQIISAQVE